MDLIGKESPDRSYSNTSWVHNEGMIMEAWKVRQCLCLHLIHDFLRPTVQILRKGEQQVVMGQWDGSIERVDEILLLCFHHVYGMDFRLLFCLHRRDPHDH